MANTVLIIGNGFDIDLGLKSKYTDFILGSEWKNVCELIKERFPEKFHTISLLMHLLGASENKKLWFDVEYEIHEFIKKYPIKVSQISDSHSGLAKKEFIMLRKAFSLIMGFDIMGPGTFTTASGKFTKIEVTARNSISGTGWSGDYNKMTWEGEASKPHLGRLTSECKVQRSRR